MLTYSTNRTPSIEARPPMEPEEDEDGRLDAVEFRNESDFAEMGRVATSRDVMYESELTFTGRKGGGGGRGQVRFYFVCSRFHDMEVFIFQHVLQS
jgi:hypothetical protein